MRCTLTLLSLLLAGDLFAQGGHTPNPSPEGNVNQWLYSRCDLYRKIIAKRTHPLPLQKEEPRQPLAQSKEYFQTISNDNFGQQETSVAISRVDKNLIVVGSNDDAMDVRSMPAYTSTDGGASWNTYRIPKSPAPYQAYGDPALVAAPDGTFYYAYLLYHDASGLSDILVSRSTDGKAWTYNTTVLNKKAADGFEDKESIAIDRDPQSPTYGRIYLSWLHFGDNAVQSGLRLAWSNDGARSWSKPVQVAQDSGSGFFSQVRVGEGGILYYTYSYYRDDGLSAEHYILVSTDKGNTFNRHKIADFYNYPYSKKKQTPTLKGDYGIRSFPYITFDFAAATNTIHVVYGSYAHWSNGDSSAILYYTTSDNTGMNWTPPQAIGFTGDSASLHFDRFQPSLIVDDRTNAVHLFYLSSQKDNTNRRASPYWVRLDAPDPKYLSLTDSTFDPLDVTNFDQTPFIGDYTGADATGGAFAAAWTQNIKNRSDGEIYAYVIENVDSVLRSVHLAQVSARELSIISVRPNPLRYGKLAVRFAIPKSAMVKIYLTDAAGKKVSELLQEHFAEGVTYREFDLHQLPSGIYFLILESDGVQVKENVVVE